MVSLGPSAAPLGPPPRSAITSTAPRASTRLKVPRRIATTRTEPSARGTGPSGNSRPSATTFMHAPPLKFHTQIHSEFPRRRVDAQRRQGTDGKRIVDDDVVREVLAPQGDPIARVECRPGDRRIENRVGGPRSNVADRVRRTEAGPEQALVARIRVDREIAVRRVDAVRGTKARRPLWRKHQRQVRAVDRSQSVAQIRDELVEV